MYAWCVRAGIQVVDELDGKTFQGDVEAMDKVLQLRRMATMVSRSVGRSVAVLFVLQQAIPQFCFCFVLFRFCFFRLACASWARSLSTGSVVCGHCRSRRRRPAFALIRCQGIAHLHARACMRACVRALSSCRMLDTHRCAAH